ncbi:MAG: hypothetical protein ACK55Z_05245, partial [bacterium]
MPDAAKKEIPVPLPCTLSKFLQLNYRMQPKSPRFILLLKPHILFQIISGQPSSSPSHKAHTLPSG